MNDVDLRDFGVENLFGCIRKGKTPHAVIFEGASEKERFYLSLKFSKILNCCSENKPCDVCAKCKKVDSLNHSDITIINGKDKTGSIGVDESREICNDAYIRPIESEYKIYIFKNGDKMTTQAQNALLKILEEPPKYVVFIILCKSSSSMIETIKSRTQIFSLSSRKGMESGKVHKIACEIINSVSMAQEFDIIKSSIPLLKNRDDLRKTIEEVKTILLNDYICSCEGPRCNIDVFDKSILGNISLSGCLKIIDELNIIDDMAEKNVNMNLLVNYMCVKLKNVSYLQ